MENNTELGTYSAEFTEFILQLTTDIVTFVTILYIFKVVYKKPYVSREKKIDDKIYNKECPICFTIFECPVKAQCGHAYCIDCIYNCWENSTLDITLCPLCRTPLATLDILGVCSGNEEKYSRVFRRELIQKIYLITHEIKYKNVYKCLSVIGGLYGLMIIIMSSLIILNSISIFNLIFSIYTFFAKMIFAD